MIKPHDDMLEQPMHLDPAGAEADDAQECRRRNGRRRQEGLNSTIGPVLDLSPGGMRVLCTRKLHGRKYVKIQSREGTISVQVEVCWSRRIGFRRHYVGMMFENVTEQLQHQIQIISSAHALTQRLAA